MVTYWTALDFYRGSLNLFFIVLCGPQRLGVFAVNPNTEGVYTTFPNIR